MISIANRFVKTEEEKLNLLGDVNRVELFYKVYRQVDYLTLRELRILRDFCYALNDPYDLTIRRGDETLESEDEVYYKYNDMLDNLMDEKTKRKTVSKF